MDVKTIREVAEIVKEMGLSVLEADDGKIKIRIEKAQTAVAVQPPQEVVATNPISAEDKGTDFNDLQEIKSPMVGVFYEAPAEGAAPFVKVGDKVKKGDVLCIVEAMKLMNEIVSDCDGEILDICVKNGDVVEYGQTLFKIF